MKAETIPVAYLSLPHALLGSTWTPPNVAIIERVISHPLMAWLKDWSVCSLQNLYFFFIQTSQSILYQSFLRNHSIPCPPKGILWFSITTVLKKLCRLTSPQFLRPHVGKLLETKSFANFLACQWLAGPPRAATKWAHNHKLEGNAEWKV